MSAMEICSETRVGHWEFANTLGEGAYGEVKLAINQRTQETCAVKIISLNLLEDRTAIQKEVLIHKTLSHVNIIKYISSFQQLDKFYIVLEYASGGELFDRIEPDFGMNMSLAHRYFVQLINGVEYLHSKGIVHRDLKPENLLLNDADQIKIADFGLATLFQYRGNERLLTSPCGTAPYVAPEVISKKEYKAQPTDIWSCGIVLVAMLAGELPWDKPVMDCIDFVSWVRDNNYQKSPWCKIENTALSLLRNILIYEPSQRFSIRQIKQSTWFVKAHKTPTYDQLSNHHAGLNSVDKGGDSGFLSQPTYFYLSNNNSNSGSITGTDDMDSMQTNSGGISMMSSQLEVTDSQQACECSQQASTRPGGANLAATNNQRQAFESFSQPISIDDMYLNSQALPTQQTQTQASQNPLFKLVKRMTRMFVHLDLDACTAELKSLCEKFMYDSRVCDINARQRQLTVVTRDRRQTLLTFKVNIIDMTNGPMNEVLVDFRLSKGDGLEFKRIFMKFKQSLATVVCRRYVFVNSHGCCENKRAL